MITVGGGDEAASARRMHGMLAHQALDLLVVHDFAPVGYFEVVATAHAEGGAFRMRHAPKERILERGKAQAVLAAAREFEGPLGVRVEDRRQRPPRLHDLPSLQKLCSARFGWSASKTLEVAQELYDGTDKKILTYPRAEVRYLPESAIADVPRTPVVAVAFGGLVDVEEDAPDLRLVAILGGYQNRKHDPPARSPVHVARIRTHVHRDTGLPNCPKATQWAGLDIASETTLDGIEPCLEPTRQRRQFCGEVDATLIEKGHHLCAGLDNRDLFESARLKP